MNARVHISLVKKAFKECERKMRKRLKKMVQNCPQSKWMFSVHLIKKQQRSKGPVKARWTSVMAAVDVSKTNHENQLHIDPISMLTVPERLSTKDYLLHLYTRFLTYYTYFLHNLVIYYSLIYYNKIPSYRLNFSKQRNSKIKEIRLAQHPDSKNILNIMQAS